MNEGVWTPPGHNGDLPATRPTVLRARWPLGVWLSGLVALLLALPFRLPIPGLETINVLGQAVAIAASILVLPQLSLDAVGRRPGSKLRLLVLLLAVTAIIPWAVVAARRGLAVGPLLSVVNWISLGGLMVAGQVLFGSVSRLERAATIWALVHATIAGIVVVYLLGRFGGDVFLLQDRGPFQSAIQALLPAWPNYFAIAMCVAVCVLYGRVLARRANWQVWAQIGALLAGVFFTFSRSGWLVCIAGLVVMTAVSGRLKRAAPVTIAIVVFMVVIGSQVPVIRYQVQASVTPGTSQSVTFLRRIAFAIEAIRIWRRDPMVGIGFGRFDEYATVSELTKISPVGTRGVEVLGSVHNEYISTLLKGGIIGFVGFVALIAGATRYLRRWAADRSDTSGARWLAVTGIGITAVLMVAGLGAESFRTLATSALYWIVVGGVSVLPPPKRRLA